MTLLPTPKRTKIGKGFYQISYGDTGWITLLHSRHGDWNWSAFRYTAFFEIDGTRFGETDSKISLGSGDSYRTMAEALKYAEISLLPESEQEAFHKAERDQLEAVVVQNITRIEANQRFIADLVERGLYEPDPKKRAAKRRKETRERAQRLKAMGIKL